MKTFLIIWWASYGVLFYIWRLTEVIKDGSLKDVWKNGDRVKVIFEYFITAIPLSIIVWPHEVCFRLRSYYRYKHHPEERTDYKKYADLKDFEKALGIEWNELTPPWEEEHND